MNQSESIQELIREVSALVQQEGRGNPPTISVSPEVAERMERIMSAQTSAKTITEESAVPAKSIHPVVFSPDEAYEEAERCNTLDELQQLLGTCCRCGLGATRTNSVFGSGNPETRLMFVGEAPGHDEDLQGLPFVGRAGQLLTDIIEKGMGLKRSDVYICNVLKCRPPENRNPLPEEVAKCEPYLIRQVELIQPRVICALGTYAAQTLLKTQETIGKLRGRWHFYHGIPLRATYHPAYLLRNPAEKRRTWDDVLEVLKVYNGEFTPEP